MRIATPARVVRDAQTGVRRSALRRDLHAVVSGKSGAVALDLDNTHLDVASVIEEFTFRKSMQSAPVQRLVVALKKNGAADGVVERLAAKSPQQRVQSARIVGALRMYEAVPWVAQLLDSRDRSVSDAAARALGRIGGTGSARALIKAISRKGLNRRLVAELARAAPDLLVESALAEPQPQSVRPALAIAAGLRRRRAAVGPLIALLENGSRRERVISCRALGWIGARNAVPIIAAALQDRDWKIRMSAVKALGALRARTVQDDLRYLQIDRNARVRKAANMALARLNRGNAHGA